MNKAADAFRTISEVADDLEVPKHVLRFWENRFPQIKPMKRGGGRRYYRPADLDLLRGIRHLLHTEGYTIKGVQKILKQQGVETVKACWQPGQALPSQDRAAAHETDLPAPERGRQRKLKGGVRGTAATTGSGRAAASRAGADHAGTAQAIAAMIAELQACRALLTVTAAPAQAATTGGRARARR